MEGMVNEAEPRDVSLPTSLGRGVITWLAATRLLVR